jgi:uncharacterized protein YwqG
MNEEQLYQRWQAAFREYLEQNVGKFDPHLVYEHCIPAFFRTDLKGVERDEPLEPGLSRLDGLPDLPESVEWPQHGGRSLDFVAQINLGDFEKGFHPSLPEHGWLFFFYEGNYWGKDSAHHRVLYFDGPVNQLVRAAPSAALQPPEQIGERTALIQFEPGFTLEPEFYWQVFFNELESKTPPGFPNVVPPTHQCQPEITRMGGYGYSFQGSKPDRDARLFLNGFPTLIEFGYCYPVPPFKDQAKREEYFQKKWDRVVKAGKEKLFEQEMERYRLIEGEIENHTAPVEMLLGLESALGRSWADSGFLQFFIRQDDLKLRNFERTYCEIIST